MRVHNDLWIAAAVVVLSVGGPGLAVAGTSDNPSGEARSGMDCVFFGTVDNWQVLDDSSLVIWTHGESTAYLVRLFRRSPDLRFSIDLGFQDANRDGQLCPYGGDAVITEGPMAERLPIDSITKLSEPQLKDLLASHESTRGKRHKRADKDAS